MALTRSLFHTHMSSGGKRIGIMTPPHKVLRDPAPKAATLLTPEGIGHNGYIAKCNSGVSPATALTLQMPSGPGFQHRVLQDRGSLLSCIISQVHLHHQLLPFSAGKALPTLAAATKSLQSCPTLGVPMDCSLPGSSAHGILQTRVLEWVATAFSPTLDFPQT